MTIRELIDQLSKLDPDDPIVFGYVTSTRENFAEISEYLDTNEQFADDTAELFASWIAEADDILYSIEQESN